MNMSKTNLTKSDMKHLPKVNGDDFKESCAYYTELIFTKTDKTTAFRLAFPDRYKKAISNAGDNDKLIASKIKKGINTVESSAFMKECFYTANKHWWMKFMGKKQRVFEKLYEDAISDDIDIKDRHNASKIFLAHIPDAPKEDTIKVEVKVGSDEFKSMLMQKKKLIHNTANEDIIDAETE